MFINNQSFQLLKVKRTEAIALLMPYILVFIHFKFAFDSIGLNYGHPP